MQKQVFAGLFLFCLFSVAGGGAQSLGDNEKPVWTMETLKVMPGQMVPTLGYLDETWMRIREEAKHQGVVLNYHRIAEQNTPESGATIVLLTEYKNKITYEARKTIFAPIFKKLSGNSQRNFVLDQHQDLYETMSTQVFQDYQDAKSVQFRLLTKN